MYFEEENDILEHIGTPHQGGTPHSGRWEWGSGENPYQHEDSFLGTIAYMQKQGMTEKEIAASLGMSQNELRKRKSAEKDKQIQDEMATFRKLYLETNGNLLEVSRRMGIPEATLRSRLKGNVEANSMRTDQAAEVIKDAMTRHRFVDVGEGSYEMLGVSETKMNTAIQKLVDEEGYVVKNIQVEQLGTGMKTTVKVLCPPGTTYKDVKDNSEEIGLVTEYTKNDDAGYSVLGMQRPQSIDHSRIEIKYAEEGGTQKDGVIELRRGLDELSMGGSNYAQVRIAVDDSMYLKGMAIYTDDLPPGIDIRVNSNKSIGTPIEKVFKPMEKDKEGNIDWDNPFGALIKETNGQRTYTDENGEEKLSPINIVREQGDWDTWSRNLASQFLSKQPKELIKQQLQLSEDALKDEYNDILSLQSPELKQQLLNDFAAKCDANAVNLKAAALPRQATKVILPLSDIKDDEIYAPTYEDGEQVALVRYPHGGTFEIPVLTVNNKRSKTGDAVIGKDSIDAVGISLKSAQVLSGADFDGDTVIVLPMKGQKIKTQDPLPGLKGFAENMGDLYWAPDPVYPNEEARKRDIEKRKQTRSKEMGIATNLITDMTLKGASPDELTRAVKYSMVTVDMVKHNLDYHKAFEDNGIRELQEKYQKHSNGHVGGASTLISAAKSQVYVNERKPSKYGPDPETGEKRYYETGATKRVQNKDGVWVDSDKPKQTKTNKMSEASDARTLMSEERTYAERLYADYANKCKALANQCRKEALGIRMPCQSKEANTKYSDEVKSIENKIKIAKLNKPLERQAQILGNAIVRSKKLAFPELDDDEEWVEKIKRQALSSARNVTGANKKATQVKLTENEWKAIQERAVSSTTIKTILANSDRDHIRQLATPPQQNILSKAKVTRIRNLRKANCTLSEIANEMGLSTSTISRYLNEGGTE